MNCQQSIHNGLKLIHMHADSNVAYFGVAVNAGSRDEHTHEHGLAHFVEHLLFKGTQKRKAHHILNRMENVGGELNAYTSKEETFVYAVFLHQHAQRAIELLADMIIHSNFPPAELEKERTVIIDEINSYEDNPSELIFDEFEHLLFDQHPLGLPILGTKHSLMKLDSQHACNFVKRHYTAENIKLFSMGNIDPQQLKRWCDKYFDDIPTQSYDKKRTQPLFITDPLQPVKKNKKTHQAHVIIGGTAYPMFDQQHRMPTFLLNNILGGPGMNSRLNVTLREKRGLVYNVESSVTAYTDAGLFTVYFGTDPKHREQVAQLVEKEFLKLCNEKLSTFQLHAAKKQAVGQIGVATDHAEGRFLGLGKSFLHHEHYDSLETRFEKINAVTAQQIQDVANELFKYNQRAVLVYE